MECEKKYAGYEVSPTEHYLCPECRAQDKRQAQHASNHGNDIFHKMTTKKNNVAPRLEDGMPRAGGHWAPNNHSSKAHSGSTSHKLDEKDKQHDAALNPKKRPVDAIHGSTLDRVGAPAANQEANAPSRKIGAFERPNGGANSKPKCMPSGHGSWGYANGHMLQRNSNNCNNSTSKGPKSNDKAKSTYDANGTKGNLAKLELSSLKRYLHAHELPCPKKSRTVLLSMVASPFSRQGFQDGAEITILTALAARNSKQQRL